MKNLKNFAKFSGTKQGLNQIAHTRHEHDTWERNTREEDPEAASNAAVVGTHITLARHGPR
jgi:hypothetical protein